MRGEAWIFKFFSSKTLELRDTKAIFFLNAPGICLLRYPLSIKIYIANRVANQINSRVIWITQDKVSHSFRKIQATNIPVVSVFT